jgi:prolyl-tRNA editing enzyme YbaK/EbsC (Cys-tRNA(Pro) deacylase)
MENQQERIKALLDGQGVHYQFIAHDLTLVSAEMGVEHGVGDLSAMAPTFILRTERGYLAAIVSGDSRLSYKKIKKELGLKNVSLAGPDEVKEVTGAEIGYVSLINPGLETLVDGHLLEQAWAYGGCGVPKTTMQIKPADLVRVSGARVFDFSERKEGN